MFAETYFLLMKVYKDGKTSGQNFLSKGRPKNKFWHTEFYLKRFVLLSSSEDMLEGKIFVKGARINVR